MSAPAVPKMMKALIVKPGPTVAIEEVAVPLVGDDDILVKVAATAQNPTDWKFVDLVQKHGTILGCDWSGHVVAAGKNVSSPRVGDHAAGFVQGGTFTDYGAYAEYVRTPAELSWVVPEGTLNHEEAAALGCAFWTAVQALYNPTRLGLVEPPNRVEGEPWVFIYGGSTSVGQYATQLVHLSGYKVATVASPRNHELCRTLGADFVADYNDPDAVRKIKDATGDSIGLALDTLSLAPTQAFASRVVKPAGGKVILLLGPDKDGQVREDVVLQPTLIYTALGRPFSMLGQDYPACPEDRAHMAAFLRKLPELVREGKIVPNKTVLWEGGLQAVPDGLQYMREGKVSGEKIVYRL
ncbi:GroES-like protein [Daedalea quercina L-15889]|uniref:GroES-like protein n=1 Tax=Daedalea quercina L-15889 TaxID=1314783 RepID=A0A165PHY5_9APHY|nr:GroES-like protein [Daedalea quercina L-15889]